MVKKMLRESIRKLRVEAEDCTRCPLYKFATQTVFGEGPENADVVFVGEQPGDQEDIRANRSSDRPELCSIAR